jgi:hypothetical protein
MPTYLSAASVLERKTGSGWALFGWTLARMLLIAPPMQIMGVPAKQAWKGAALSSGLISVLAMLRIFNATKTGLAGTRPRRRRR